MATNISDLSGRLQRQHGRTQPLSQSIIAGITGLIDLTVVLATGFGLWAVYLVDTDPVTLPFYVAAILIYAVMLLQTLYAAGLYRFTWVIDPAKHAPRVIAIVVLLFLLMLAAGFALKLSHEFSRIWAFGWLSALVLLLPTARFAVASAVRHWAEQGRIRRNIVVYGAGTQGERLIRHIKKLNEPWNQIIGVFDDRKGRVNSEIDGYPVIGTLADLVLWGQENRADEILIALPWSAEERLANITHSLAPLPTNIRLSPEFVGVDMAYSTTSYQFGVPMLSVMEKPVSGWGALAKLVLDYVLGTLFLLIAAPLMVLVAIAIKLESRGPVLFRQQRYGFNNQLIGVYKFRTMYTDRTDSNAERLVERGDPRVTRVGAILRRLSIDELPQLLNVLRGEMSVVGPRPHALKAKAAGRLYAEVVDQYAVRHKVKPGITGWAQVNGWRGNTETEKDIIGRVECDLYYINNWSVLFDMAIILRTIWVVLSARNSY